MAEYADDIQTSNYKYRRTIYFTNDSSQPKEDYVVKLLLNESNFNFELPKSDGSDFRLLMNGSTLKMWVPYWSKSARKAVLFFMIPFIPAGATRDLVAYWGHEDAESISNPDDMEFLFTEEFNSTPLDSDKWSGDINNGLTQYGYFVAYRNDVFTTKGKPLTGKYSFRIECGVNPTWTSGDYGSGLYAIGFNFSGTENDFMVGIHDTGGVSTCVDGSSTQRTGLYYGLENNSYNDVVVEYKESQDRVIVRLKNRDTYGDVEYYWGRKVEGDTRPDNFGVSGRNYASYKSAMYPTYIAWLAVREFGSEEVGVLDASTLWIEHEYVGHQSTDIREFGPDITTTLYRHESSFGGNPYKISDNGYDSNTDLWLTDDDALAEDYVYLTMHTGWSSNVVSREYIHYDSGHVYHYNASRLSSEDSPQGWNHMELTTSSGWAAIKFSNTRVIGAFQIKATEAAGTAPKDFVFYGSNFNPVIDYSRARVLKEGTFADTSEWQFQVLTHNQPYRYYILEVQNTYGGGNIQIQEWEMMDSLSQRERRYPGQLRLHPSLYGDYQYNFPKQISLQGTVDGYTWVTLIPWTQTYTPFISHNPAYGYWQRYSFDNLNGYWSFRLLCKDHWLAQDDRIAIAEWELRELASEAETFHILSGTSNNVTQIWAQEDCRLDDADALFFTAADKLSRIMDNRLVGSSELPDEFLDINVVQESS